MKYSFINLESCSDRREFVIDNFKQCTHIGGQNIDRISAFDVAYVIKHGISGKIKPTEIACYLSHCKAIRSSLTHNDHIFIAEDDVLFCDQSTKIIENAVSGIDPESWDVIYTDMAFSHAETMTNFFSNRRQFDLDREFKYFDILNFQYSGATAYIINKSSKQKVINLIDINDFNFAFDIALRRLIRLEKKLKGLLLFPFPTSLSRFSENSQIQSDHDLTVDFLFNTYRRLVWLDRDIKDVASTLNKIKEDFYDDDDANAFAAVIKQIDINPIGEDGSAFYNLLRAMWIKKDKTK